MAQDRSAHLFNKSEIVRKDESSLFVEFYAGDILSIYSDALIISTYRGSYHPVPGSIQGALRDRFGIEYGSCLPPGTVSVHPNLHRFPAPPSDAFKNIWMIEVRDVLDSTPVTAGEMRKAFAVLRKHIGDIAGSNVKSISLPLIGTGYLRLNLEEVIWETLDLIRRWTVAAPSLEFVRVFAYDVEKFATLNRTVDRLFGFASNESISLLLKATRAELDQKLANFSEPDIVKTLRAIVHLAGNSQPSAKSIAVEGRTLAEICSRLLFKRLKPEARPPEKLSGLINEVEPMIKEKGQTWIINYFRLLQTCGNNAAHPSDVNVNLTDAAAVVVAALRAAEFTRDETPARTA